MAQYILDLNLNNAITNGTLTDNIGNVFTVNGNPSLDLFSDIGVVRGGSYGYIGTVDAIRIKRGVALYTGTSYKVPLILK